MAVIYVDDKSKLPDKIPHDFYPTPVPLVRSFFEEFPCYEEFTYPYILDPGSGEGNWGLGLSQVVRNTSSYWLTGVEMRPVERPKDVYNVWVNNQDYLTWDTKEKFEIVMGNPPYSNRLAEKFIHRSFDLLVDGGYLIFLLKLSFLQTKTRYEEFFKYPALRPSYAYVSVRRVNFTGPGNPDVYAILVWQKTPWTDNKETVIRWLDWEDK